ncbi:3-oxoacyl-(acyl-carrier-protein) synthase [Minicystis rosea]|nr:3-oxoacyl-(acyl-carrier-protein) synthase [Minicystis rosea]
MKTLATIVSVGAITPVGLGAVDSAFSHRAAAAAMREAPLVDREGEPITMCFLPNLDPLLVGADRAFVLGRRALAEAVSGLGAGASTLRVRLSLTLDEPFGERGADGAPLAQAFVESLARTVAKTLPDLQIEASARGPAGPAYLLPPLCDALASGAIDAAILGGVHTDYDPRRIAALSASERLFRNDNIDAFIPGEAAAFVVLMRADTARRLDLRVQAEIRATATGYEKARPDNDASAFQASGLTAALRTVMAPLAQVGLRAGWMLTDLTFEVFRHFELQAASVRTQRWFCEPQQVDSPAQRLGHLGAAAMPLHLVFAAEGFRRGYAPHPYAISIAGSDSGERGAVLISAPD